MTFFYQWVACDLLLDNQTLYLELSPTQKHVSYFKCMRGGGIFEILVAQKLQYENGG